MNSAKYVKVTPELAEEWLKHNKRNRSLKTNVVKQYASDMKAGRWVESNCDPVVFNEFGELENGQHRLNAIIWAGVPITLFVVDGIPSAMGTFDIGAKRTTSDFLKIRGASFSANAISATRYIMKQYGFRQPTNAAIESYMLNHQADIEMAVNVVMPGTNHPISKKAGCVVAAYAAMRCGGVSEDELREFFTIVNTGFMEQRWQSAPIVFRNMLVGLQQRGIARRGGETLPSEIRGACELAIKDYLRRHPRQHMYAPTEVTPYFPLLLKEDQKELDALIALQKNKK